MVVVPAFAHGDQSGEIDIATLDAGALHMPVAGVAAVRQVFAGAGISLEPWPDGPGNA